MGTGRSPRSRSEPALQAEIDDLVEGALFRAIAERRQCGARGSAIGASALQGFRERAVGAQQLDRVLEVAFFLPQLLERAAPEALLVFAAAAEGHYDRQRDL